MIESYPEHHHQFLKENAELKFKLYPTKNKFISESFCMTRKRYSLFEVFKNFFSLFFILANFKIVYCLK